MIVESVQAALRSLATVNWAEAAGAATSSPVLAFTVFFLASLAAFSFLYAWMAPLTKLPGPCRHIPFFGHYLQLYPQMSRVTEFALETQLKMGGTRTWALSVPGQVYVMITDPKNIEYVLKTNFDNFEKGLPFTEKFFELLGTGIFNSDGAAWRLQRKTASHLFTMKELRGYMSQVFLDHGWQLLRKLELAAQRPGTIIDLQELFFQFTFDSIAEIAFGLKVGTLSQPMSVYDSSLGALPVDQWIRPTSHCGSDVSAEKGVEFARAFDAVQCAIEKRFYQPHWKLLRLIRWGAEKKIAAGVTLLKDFAYDVIAGRRKLAAENGLGTRSDLLTMFVRQSQEMQLRGEPGFDDDYLRDVILNFIIAGRDTTAQALSWTSYMLAQHDKELATMRQEIARLPAFVDGESRDFHEAHRLRYTEAVVSETLRLYPSVPKDVKTPVRDDVLPDGTVVKKGWLVGYLPYVMGRMDCLWSEAARWMPERWLTSSARVRAEDDADGGAPGGVGTTQLDSFSPFVYPVFQAGPRTCLGKHVALLEAKTMIAMLFHHFDISVADGAVVEPMDSVTLPIRHGLKVTVSQRAPLPSHV